VGSFVFWGAILSKSKVLDFVPSDVDSEDPSEMESVHSAEGIPESVEAGEVGGAQEFMEITLR
jgi:hypothetical protein